MGKPTVEHHGEVQRLQRVLRTRQQELAAVDADTEAYRVQQAKVFASTRTLLDFEARIPVLLDEQRRQVSSRIVYAAGAAAAVAMLVALTLIGVGRVSRWYLLPVIVVGVVAAAIAFAERGAERAGHRSRAAAAVIALVAAVLTIIVIAQVLSAFTLLGLVPLVLTAGFCWVHDGPDDEDAA